MLRILKFELNADIYQQLHINFQGQSGCGKIRTKKTPSLDQSDTVSSFESTGAVQKFTLKLTQLKTKFFQGNFTISNTTDPYRTNPANKYNKASKRNTRKGSEIYSKSTIETPEGRH